MLKTYAITVERTIIQKTIIYVGSVDEANACGIATDMTRRPDYLEWTDKPDSDGVYTIVKSEPFVYACNFDDLPVAIP